MSVTGGIRAVATDGDLLDDWSRWMQAESLAARTINERVRIVHHAAAHIGADPTMFTTDELIDYLAQLRSSATRQTYFGALRAWHFWLIEQGYSLSNPMARLRRPRCPKRRPRPVATPHLQRLLASGIRGRTRTAVLLCSYQGLRVHEAAKIRGEDVDLLGGTLRVIGKGGVDEQVPLHPLIAAEARRYPRLGYWFPSHTRPGHPIRRESLSAVISRAMQRAGVPGTAHSLRHWYGTELVRGGVNVRVVQTLMRHASLATTALYTLVDADQQRLGLLALPSLDPQSRP